MTAAEPERRAAVAGGLVGLANAMRASGLRVSTDSLQTAAEALTCVDASDPTQAYWALRCALISGPDEAEAFDRALAAAAADFPPPTPSGRDPDQTGEPGPWPSPPSPVDALGDLPDDAGNDERSTAALGAWSAAERLRQLDFADYDAESLRAARPLIARIAQALPRRRSRRMAARVRGRSPDLRRTLRGALRTGGDPVRLHSRGVVESERRMVFLLDVSGSMQAYALPVTIFLHAVRRSSRRVEAFAFGTRATRLTRALATKDPETALARVAEAAPDWAGGTRIGASLRSVRLELGGGLAMRGAVVVIVSDGWERGELDLLAEEMERIQRAAHAVVWVNPLAGDPGYEPLAAGMATARPFIDVFLPGHDLRSMEALAALLEGLTSGEKPADRGVEPHASPSSNQGLS